MNNIGAFVLAYNQKRILLVQKNYDTNNWGLPGGSVDNGESIVKAANRELYEETNLKIDEKELQHFATFYSIQNYSLAFCFELKLKVFVTDLNPNTPDIKDVKFFSLEELPTNISSRSLFQIEKFFSKSNIKVSLYEYK